MEIFTANVNEDRVVYYLIFAEKDKPSWVKISIICKIQHFKRLVELLKQLCNM
jgi:hypothetical protein